MSTPIIIYNLSIWAAGLFDIILFICSLIFCTRNQAPRCLKLFPFYAALNIVSDIIAISFPNLITADYTIFSLLEMLYFSYLLITAINRTPVTRLIWLSNGIVIAILAVLLWYHPSLVGGLLLHFEALIIILGTVVYLYNITSKRLSPPLSKDPLFWFAIGLTLYFFIDLAILFISGSYSFLQKPVLSNAFYSVNNFTAVCTYILFIKGMSCIPKK
jgi:hypothetical protein